MGIPSYLLIHTATRVRAATSTDSYNNTVTDWGAAASRTDMAAWLQQNTRTEPRSDGRDPLEQTWLLITNEDDVLGTDRFEIDGTTYEVEGPPEKVYTPAGYHHLETTLRLVTG
jgi:hypothetical protein